MTDSEKAEESLEKRKGEYWCIKTDNVYVPYTEGYKDGLAEGRKEKWHNLRENPNDLPKENGCYWGYVNYFGFQHRKIYWLGKRFDITGVIAWCDLPEFKG